MIAYKFLREGRVAPFSGVRWPEAGEWLETESVELCRTGVHACRPRDLPHWFGLLPELWQVELDGEIVTGELTVAASRGRLVRRIEAWNRETELAFAQGCVAEARRRLEKSPALEPFALDAERTAASTPAVTAFVTARMAEMQDGSTGYDVERARQARWLADRLGL